MYPLRGGGCGGRRRSLPVLVENGALFRKNERLIREGSRKHKKHICIPGFFTVKWKISIFGYVKIIVKYVGLFRQRRESIVKYVGLYGRRHESVVKYVGLYGRRRESVVKYVGLYGWSLL